MINLRKVFIYLILLITLIRVNTYSSLTIGSTFFWWIIEFFTIALLIYFSRSIKIKGGSKQTWPVKLFLAWNIICIVRGGFVAENYWEWKNLVGTSFMLMIPLIVFLMEDRFLPQQIISKWMKFMPLLFLLFLPFITAPDLWGKYFVPILFLLPFIYFLRPKHKIWILTLTSLVVFFSLDARSNILRFLVAGLLGGAYYFRTLISVRLIKFINNLLYLTPVIFLALGVLGIFNVFKMNEYISGDYSVTVIRDGETQQSSLTSDSRTFLYVEVIESAIQHNYLIQGRTPARGYDSKYFGDYLADDLKTGKRERFASEVAIHNIFTWNGLIGVIFYFLSFFIASILAIYRSNSFVMKFIGLFIAFRWVYAFVEDFTTFELQYIFIWITIGMCYSKVFRSMTDYDFKVWIRSIFDFNYRLNSIHRTKNDI